MDEYREHANFFDYIIRARLGGDPGGLTVLDLGCGAGEMVEALECRGYSVYGCDVGGDYTRLGSETAKLRRIESEPYRLPFEDGFFDVVISNQVFEHVRNKIETFVEIKRVLKPGGLTAHVFPSKFTPIEVHINVPFFSWFWPKVPAAWVNFWAILGVRNRYQSGMNWRQVAKDNMNYGQVALDYRSMSFYDKIAKNLFDEVETPMLEYVVNTNGKKSLILKKLPFLNITSKLIGVFDQRVIVARKAH